MWGGARNKEKKGGERDGKRTGGKERPKATKKTKTKQQQNTNAVRRTNPPSHLPTPQFPQQKHPRRIRGLLGVAAGDAAASRSHRERNAAHETLGRFNVLPASRTALSLADAAQNKQLSKGRRGGRGEVARRANGEGAKRRGKKPSKGPVRRGTPLRIWVRPGFFPSSVRRFEEGHFAVDE